MSYNFVQEINRESSRKCKIFISHASADKQLVTAFVELLEGLGIAPDQIFYSSLKEYGVPMGEDIFEYLRYELLGNKVYVIFFLSDAYYQSVACLNEMGAAWILRSDYLTVLQPGFEFREIKGAVNPRRTVLDLNIDCRESLNEFFEKLKMMFSLKKISYNRWERYRDRFMRQLSREISAQISANKAIYGEDNKIF